MPIVAMINRKGGVGKTTLTIALADFLSTIHARNILVIDVDPQANASLALLGPDHWEDADTQKHTVADIFERAMSPKPARNSGDATPMIREVRRSRGCLGRLSVIPSSPRLQTIEERTLEGDPAWRYAMGSPYLVLHQALFGLANDYDDVLIDCPPSVSIVTLNALTLAAGYLIPTTPDHIATIGIPQIVQKMTDHSNNLRRSTVRYGTVVNRFRRSAFLHQAKLDELRNDPNCEPVWDTIVPDTVRGQESMNTEATELTLKSRYGGGTHGLYQAFESLAAEFLARIG